MLIALGPDSTKSVGDVPEIPRQGFMRLPLLPLPYLLQWAEFADGFAGVIGWPFGIDMYDDPRSVCLHTIRWLWYFLTAKDSGDTPERWS